METNKKHPRTIKDIHCKTRRLFSTEQKTAIVAEGIRAENAVKEICRKYGIVESLFYKWNKEALADLMIRCDILKKLCSIWAERKNHQVYAIKCNRENKNHPFGNGIGFGRQPYTSRIGDQQTLFIQLVQYLSEVWYGQLFALSKELKGRRCSYIPEGQKNIMN